MPIHAPADNLESNFGAERPFSIGVEEELLLVGSDMRLRARAAEMVQEAQPEDGEIVRELFTSMVESNSQVCSTAGEAVAALREMRRRMLDEGASLMGVGIHPDINAGEAETGGAPRYEAIKEDLQGILRTPICGQHVHVGMADEDSAVNAYNGIRTHVPLLNALAANSPYWFGRDSGLASARTVIFRSYPRAAMAPEFDDFDHFNRVTREVCTAAGLDDYTHIWWDARIHPALGTVEVRALDAQSDLDRVRGLAALVHCMTRIEAERSQEGIPSREALAESSFQATRHGLDATLLDRSAQPVPARDLARRCLDEAAEIATEFGCEEDLASVEKILSEGNGAERQRRAFADGGMDGLLEFLARESADLGDG